MTAEEPKKEDRVVGQGGLHRISVLVEFRKDDQIVESLIFPVPPESIEISQPMKKNISQTWGGAYINHFGLGLGTISFSGHTGGYGEKRLTKGGPQRVLEGPWDSGQTIQQILHRIARYPKAKLTQRNFSDLECRIYDLSTFSPKSIFLEDKKAKKAEEIGEEDEEEEEEETYQFSAENSPLGYIVSIDNFRYSRSAEKPGFYQYTLSATILSYIGEYREIEKFVLVDEKEDKTSFWDFINAINDATQKIHQIRGKIQSGINAATAPAVALNRSFEQITNSIIAYRGIVQIYFILRARLQITTQKLG